MESDLSLSSEREKIVEMLKCPPQKNLHILVIGEPRIGKSTLINSLVAAIHEHGYCNGQDHRQMIRAESVGSDITSTSQMRRYSLEDAEHLTPIQFGIYEPLSLQMHDLQANIWDAPGFDAKDDHYMMIKPKGVNKPSENMQNRSHSSSRPLSCWYFASQLYGRENHVENTEHLLINDKMSYQAAHLNPYTTDGVGKLQKENAKTKIQYLEQEEIGEKGIIQLLLTDLGLFIEGFMVFIKDKMFSLPFCKEILTDNQGEYPSGYKTSEGNNRYLCIVCNIRVCDLVVFPCSHFAMCQQCGKNLEACPQCDATIRGTCHAHFN